MAEVIGNRARGGPCPVCLLRPVFLLRFDASEACDLNQDPQSPMLPATGGPLTNRFNGTMREPLLSHACGIVA